MSTIGSPIESSLLQAAQAQQVAAKQRDKEKAATDSKARYQDLVDLRVAGIEGAEAVRKLPRNDSEQAETEHEGKDTPATRDSLPAGGEDEQPHIDLQA